MAQRVGPVTINDDASDDDLTTIEVPSEAVGFVTGAQGNFLRSIEEEWGTLMFFADFRGRWFRHRSAGKLPSVDRGGVGHAHVFCRFPRPLVSSQERRETSFGRSRRSG